MLPESDSGWESPGIVRREERVVMESVSRWWRFRASFRLKLQDRALIALLTRHEEGTRHGPIEWVYALVHLGCIAVSTGRCRILDALSLLSIPLTTDWLLFEGSIDLLLGVDVVLDRFRDRR